MATAILPSLRLRPSFSTATSTSPFSSSSSSGNVIPRPAVILPGLGNNSGDYKKLEVTLAEYGVPVVVAAVSRLDWFRNAAGLVDPAYWRGTLRPRPVLDWYLNRIDDAVREANELAQGQGLSLIGHSAGGWLARVYLEEYGNSDISLLLTLGTPHLPPPRGQSGVIDQTRGLLYYVEEHCAKAVYTPKLRYVCIAGRYIRGAPLVENADMDVDSDVNVGIDGGEAISELAKASNIKSSSGDTSGPSFRARFVGQGYKQVCGRADVWGDGVVPEVSAHLEGALNVSFEGVYHSPVGSDDETRPWYGSPAIVKDWIHHLLEIPNNGVKFPVEALRLLQYDKQGVKEKTIDFDFDCSATCRYKVETFDFWY